MQTTSTKDANPAAQSSIPPPMTQGTPVQSYMAISPSARALDFQQAFEQLRKEKTAGKVYFQLIDGTTIANIIEMSLMSNSTLILFRFNSNQGIRFQIVKIEDILNIYY
jgi:hypothetical protein